MKKTLLFITASIFVAFNGNSQLINSGFESWISQGAYEEPEGWGTFNFLSAFGLPVLVNKDADAHNGSFSAKLETSEVTFFGETDTLSGLLMYGSDGTGVAYTLRPGGMEFYYKYSSPGADNGQAVVTLTKWDAVNNEQLLVGGGSFEINTAANFTLGSVDIMYNLPDAPDTLQIMFIPSASDMPIPGTTLHVDDVSLTGLAAVTNLSAQKPVVYPNPANDYLFVKTAGLKISDIEITDLSGRVVEKISLSGANDKISVAHFHNGNYFYELKNGQESVSRGQFHVSH